RRRHTRWPRDWSSDVCSSDLYLAHVGIHWSPHPTDDEARREYERVCASLERRFTHELIGRRLLDDQAPLATLDVLTKLVPPAFLDRKSTRLNSSHVAISYAVF